MTAGFGGTCGRAGTPAPTHPAPPIALRCNILTSWAWLSSADPGLAAIGTARLPKGTYNQTCSGMLNITGGFLGCHLSLRACRVQGLGLTWQRLGSSLIQDSTAMLMAS